MKIPILLEVPSAPELVDIARNELHRGAVASISKNLVPPELELGPSTNLAPAPASETRGTLMGDSAAETASSFLVSGSIDVNSPDEIPHEIGGQRVLADPQVETFETVCLDDEPMGTVEDVVEALRLEELHTAGLDGNGVAIAIVDKGINLDFLEEKLGFRPKIDTRYSWQPPGISRDPGDYPVGHGTMCAYAALVAAPKATLIDVPALVATPTGGSRIGRRLSFANLGMALLNSYWAMAFTAAGTRKYNGLIVSNSWGLYHSSWDFPVGHPGRYSDNPNHPFTVSIAGMAQFSAMDFVFAAGNCGSDCPDALCQGETDETIRGVNASEYVLTVGGKILGGGTAGYSSIGPSVPGMSEAKPDLLAFTHFHGSEALGVGTPDKGTSAACPLAAGCIAALRTKLPSDTVAPLSMSGQIRSSSEASNGSAWNPNDGYGLIDPLACARDIGLLGGPSLAFRSDLDR